MSNFVKILRCILCDNKSNDTILDFKSTPIGNDLIQRKYIDLKIVKYPLSVKQCNICGHHQLSISVNRKILYAKNYTYLSGVSKEFINYFKEYSLKLISKLNINNKDLIIDIGSNDGSLLFQFKKYSKCKVLGIDPSKIPVKIAKANNINSINKFFNFNLSKIIRKNYPIPKLITTHNTFAHVSDLNDFFRGINNICGKNTTVIIEIGYWLEVVRNNWFDTIYHEHHDYHSLKPLVVFFHKFDFNIIDFKITKPQGGSLMLFLRRDVKNIIYKKIERQINFEIKFGLYKKSNYKKIFQKLLKTKKHINKIITKYNKNKLMVCAYGSPTKAVTLLSFLNLKKNYIKKIYEDNKIKCNLYNPYNKIPIIHSSSILKDNPDLIIILAWNFYKSIVRNNKKYINKKGLFLIPLPKPFFK